MPITKYLVSSLPSPYRDFLIDLEKRLDRESRLTFSNIRPKPVKGKRQLTPLDRHLGNLRHLGGCEAVSTVAKKAYQTQVGAKAIEMLTEHAITIPDIIKTTPSDLEKVQRERLERVLSAIKGLSGLIEEDRATLTALDKGVELEDYTNEIDEGEETDLPEDFYYSYSLSNVTSDKVIISRLFNIDREVKKLIGRPISGTLSPYNLLILLKSFEEPLRSHINILKPFPDAVPRGDLLTRRTVYFLFDALDQFAIDFNQGRMRHLKRTALVAAFVTGLLNPFPDQSTAQRRVNEIIERREKKLTR